MEESGNKYYWVFDENYEWLPARLKDIKDNELYILETTINGKVIKKEMNKKNFQLQEVHPSCLSKTV